MLIDLTAEFFAAAAAPDPLEAYRRYYENNKPLLSAYWHNYILDPDSPQAEEVMRRAVLAERRDLHQLLDHVDVASLAAETFERCEQTFGVERDTDVCLMVGVGGANAGELVVGGRGIAFVCLEHFTGRPNADTYGLGLSPKFLPLWIAHELAHTVRYTSYLSRSEISRLVFDRQGYFDYWDVSSQAKLRELLVNEGLAVAGSMLVAPGFDVLDYYGYGSRQYRRLRELEAFLKRAVASELDKTGIGYRLRYLTGGVSQTSRMVSGKVLPERSGYYLGRRMVADQVSDLGIATALRAEAEVFDANIFDQPDSASGARPA